MPLITCPNCRNVRTIADSTYRYRCNRNKICISCSSKINLTHIKNHGIYPRKSLVERFWAKVLKTDSCWIWQGYKNPITGYGTIEINKKPHLVHRISYELFNNIKLPNGHEVEINHICRNRLCVNPTHLELVTHRENTLKGIGITALHAITTHCPKGHPYNELNTYHRPDGGRDCKICSRERSKKYLVHKEVEK